jgi:hypothetical protein
VLVSTRANYITRYLQNNTTDRFHLASLHRLWHQRLLKPNDQIIGDGNDPTEYQIVHHPVLAVLFHGIAVLQLINAILNIRSLIVE